MSQQTGIRIIEPKTITRVRLALARKGGFKKKQPSKPKGMKTDPNKWNRWAERWNNWVADANSAASAQEKLQNAQGKLSKAYSGLSGLIK